MVVEVQMDVMVIPVLLVHMVVMDPQETKDQLVKMVQPVQ
jgi:hypothetical protein